MAEINWCVELLRIAPATIIGAAVAYVAWRQWRTANAKLKLELFERRWSIYNGIVQKLREFHSPHRKPIDDFIQEMDDLMLEIPFLFGREITAVINQWIELARKLDFAKTHSSCRDANNQPNNLVREEINELGPKISAKVEEFSRLCNSYMDMSQEPFSLLRWLKQCGIKR